MSRNCNRRSSARSLRWSDRHGARRLPNKHRRRKSTLSPKCPSSARILCAIVQDINFAQLAVARSRAEYFTHPGYREIIIALQQLLQEKQPPDIRYVTGDESLTALIATLAVREPLPIENLPKEHMLERLREEYELRQSSPQEIPLDDHAAAEAFILRQRERSRRVAQRGDYGGQ